MSGTMEYRHHLKDAMLNVWKRMFGLKKPLKEFWLSDNDTEFIQKRNGMVEQKVQDTKQVKHNVCCLIDFRDLVIVKL